MKKKTDKFSMPTGAVIVKKPVAKPATKKKKQWEDQEKDGPIGFLEIVHFDKQNGQRKGWVCDSLKQTLFWKILMLEFGYTITKKWLSIKLKYYAYSTT